MNSIKRRTLLGGAAGIAIAFTSTGRMAMAEETKSNKPRFAFTGSRTTKERKARGLGIEVYRIGDQETQWEHTQRVGDLVNPSFLITDSHQRFVFTVHGDQSEISSFQIDEETGKLSKISTVGTRGKNPVHLVPHVSSNSILVANYATGSLVRVPVSASGHLGEAGEPLSLPGEPGPHKREQSSSHPHQIVADPKGNFFIVPDKGLDQIFTIAVKEDGKLEIVSSTASRQGAGPRHMVFSSSGEFAYVVNELDSTLTTYRYDAETGKLAAVQVVTSLPTDFVGDSRAAAIVISRDGRSLYATNRGHNSIVHYKVSEQTGLLESPRWHQTGGGGPRFASISPSGKTLFVANELTDTIVSFEIGSMGELTANGQVVETGSPVSIVMI